MNQQQTIEYYRDNSSARWSALLIVSIGNFLMSLSLSATLVAIPAIAESLQTHAVYVSWIPAVFIVANLVTLLPAGRLADIYGRKKLFLIGSFIFTLSSLLAGLSESIELLLVFRGFQGVGAALFFSTGMAIITSVFRSGGRGMAMGIVVALVYLGLSFGPLLGGLLTDKLGWHWVFFAPVPFMLLSILLALFKLKGDWRSAVSAPMDWLGTAIFTAFVVVLFAGLSTLPKPSAWLLLSIDACLFWLFLRHTKKIKYPLINLQVVIKNKALTRSVLAANFMYAGNYSLIFLLSIYLQLKLNLSPTEAGKVLMAQALFMAMFAPIAGKLSDHFASRIISASGAFFAAVGCSFLLFMETSTLMQIGVSLAVVGIGFGLFSTPNTNEALGSVSENELGIVSGLINLARLMGQMLGTALLTLVITLNIGEVQISSNHQEALQSIFLWVVGFAFIFSLTAVALSLFKPRRKRL